MLHRDNARTSLTTSFPLIFASRALPIQTSEPLAVTGKAGQGFLIGNCILVCQCGVGRSAIFGGPKPIGFYMGMENQ